MRRSRCLCPPTLVLLLAAALWPVPSAAQVVFEAAGERALGMAGAFVAVADDATAAHWNPAGLATGGPVGLTTGWHRFRFGNPDGNLRLGTGRRSSSFTSLGAWPLGLSYGTFRDAWIVDDQTASYAVQTLRVNQVGVSILQSVLPGVVVGSTLKVLRGGAARIPAAGATLREVLDAGEAVDLDRSTAFDLDVSLMASSDLIRVGLVLKNLRSPSFGAIPGTGASLRRQARVGLAVTPATGVTLAMDIDLDTVDLAGGLRRMGAVGGEAMVGSRVGIRSGVRWSLVGPRRPVGAVGLSVAVRRGFWLDGHYAQGPDDDEQEIGVALRAGF